MTVQIEKIASARFSALRGSPANRPGLRELAAGGRTSAASVSTLPHSFAFVFPAFRCAGFTQVGAHAADAVSEFRTSRKQG